MADQLAIDHPETDLQPTMKFAICNEMFEGWLLQSLGVPSGQSTLPQDPNCREVRDSTRDRVQRFARYLVGANNRITAWSEPE